MERATKAIRDVVEKGWKSDTPESEDAGTLLAEAAVAVYDHVRNHPGFSDEERRALESALDEVKHTDLANLGEGRKNVQYLNGVGGAENFVKYLMLDRVAEKMDSPDFMNTLLHHGTMMFFHVSGWEQWTVEDIWEQHKRVKRLRANRE